MRVRSSSVAPAQGFEPVPDELVWLPAGQLREADYNPRTLSKKRFADLRLSIRDDPMFFVKRPCIVQTREGRENIIIAGAQRWKAAKANGWTSIPCTLADVDEATEREWNLKDNNSYGAWDDMKAAETLVFLLDRQRNLELTGFAEQDRMRLLGLAGVVETTGTVGEDAASLDPPEEGICKPGDLWRMGDHRLLCGDATSIDAVERLMDGRKADLVFTDPPYGVEYVGGSMTAKKRAKLQGDDCDIYAEFVPLLMQHIADTCPVYLWFAGNIVQRASTALMHSDFEIRNLLFWNKLHPHYGGYMAQYMQRHEPFFYAHKFGHSPQWFGPSNEVSVWDFDQPKKNDYHPTQKPVELVQRALRNSSMEGQLVWDAFGGSGSTLIACESMHRTCYLSEIKPEFCDVIIRRWQTYTGRTAELDAD